MDSLLQWLEMPLDSWLACAAVLLLGAFVQRATGFGLAVVGAPLLLMIEPRRVVLNNTGSMSFSTLCCPVH